MIDFCVDARMAFSSGIGTYIREIIPLLKENFRIRLLVDQLGHEWCKDFEQILCRAPIYSLREQWELPLKIPKVDLFWSPHYNTPLLPIRSRKRVVTVHDVCHLIFGSWIEKKYAKFMIRKALNADRVITVSQFSKNEIETWFGKRNLTAIPIGVNQEIFFRRDFSDKLRKKYRLPEKFILFVGSRKPHKNLDRLKRVCVKMDLELISVGKDFQEVSQEDLPFVYSMARLLVCPSLYEGFGLPPLEAMGCGCPSVVSKAASLSEVCGDASVYFDPTSEEDMIAAIQKGLLQTKELIEKGFQRVQLFDWKETANRHAKVFEEAFHA